MRPLVDTERTRSIFLLCVALLCMSLLLTSYLCPDQVCGRSSRSLSYAHSSPLTLQDTRAPARKLSFDQITSDNSFTFNIKDRDVIVFLHIQKTGGTSFGRHLVRDLDLETPCVCTKGKKRCKCSRTSDDDSGVWLFSRYSMGWKCGLHADWTELNDCVDDAMDETEGISDNSSSRRYFYITLLRNPILRFLSEWRHVQRGATWKSSRHVCNGREATTEELVSCYNGTNWKGVSLQDFIDCPSNLAINRQTRMLADLSLVGCYNLTLLGTKERESIMLESAKRNLRKMSFFGICEKQSISGYLFEKTFKMKFTKPFLQLNETRSSVALELLSDQVLQQIKDLNRLDMELYSYAVSLMQERFIRLKHQDSQFKDNFIRLSQKPLQVDEADERMMKRIEKERASVRVRPHRPSPEVLSPSTYFTYL